MFLFVDFFSHFFVGSILSDPHQGKGVSDDACHLGGARVKSERRYRQYMNRTTGYDDIRKPAKKKGGDA